MTKPKPKPKPKRRKAKAALPPVVLPRTALEQLADAARTFLKHASDYLKGP